MVTKFVKNYMSRKIGRRFCSVELAMYGRLYLLRSGASQRSRARSRSWNRSRWRCWCSSRSRTRRAKPLAPGHIKAVDPPTFIGTTRVAGHPPAKPPLLLNRGHAHHRRDEAVGVTAPSLTTGNGAAAVGGNCAVITARPKAAPAARMS